MGFTSFLERIGWRRATATRSEVAVAPPLPVVAATAPAALARPPVPVVAPMEDEAAKQRRLELVRLRQSFQTGIVDARFRELDVDRRFLEEFASRLAAGQDDFQPPPAATFDVMRMVDDPNYPVKKVAAAISCDPALAGAVLSLANSPLHRGAVPVLSLHDAIVRLGQRHLRLMLLEIALHTTRVKGRPYEALSGLVWKHSLLTAQLAHPLAQATGLDADQGYMAGLFHDVGTFAVLSAARKYATRQGRRLSAQTVVEAMRLHGHESNARVVTRWRLPESVANAVVHHRDFRAAGDDAALAAVTALANDLSRPLGAWVDRRDVDLVRHDATRYLELPGSALPSENAIVEVALKIERVAGHS
jgi:HD-like signal output (HDOD) protein